MTGYSENFRQHLLRETEEFLSRHLNGGRQVTKAAAAWPVLPNRDRDSAVCWPTPHIGGMHICRTWITLNRGEPSALTRDGVRGPSLHRDASASGKAGMGPLALTSVDRLTLRHCSAAAFRAASARPKYCRASLPSSRCAGGLS